MKRKKIDSPIGLNTFCISLLFIFGINSCGNSNEESETTDSSENIEENEIISDETEDETIENTEDADVRSVIDYYYLLPAVPYFESEIGEDSEKDRKEGLVYTNENAGYLKGGHVHGAGFTMALFKNRDDNIDYLMLQRLPYPGSMFEEFFDFLTYKDGEWTSAESLFDQANDDRDINYLSNLKGEEIISAVIPEKGTTLEFHVWDPFYGEGFENSKHVYSYKWNGVSFDFVQL